MIWFLCDTKCALRKHLFNAKEFLELFKNFKRGYLTIKSIGYFLGQDFNYHGHRVCSIGKWIGMC